VTGSTSVPRTSMPLSGVRVLDLSRILAAPLTGQLLGDLGADVIKVERPGTGDDARSYGPPFLSDADGHPTNDAGFYLSANRNKRSITVDHATPAGADLLRELARRSDVLLENYRPAVLAKYGLDHKTLHEVNPGLVYCSVTGYGLDGPYADRPGYDGVFQAMSGLMSVSGHPDGQAGAGPMKVGVSMIDVLTGLYAANAVLAALRHREVNGGAGQHIDVSLLDCGVAALSHYAQNYLVSGEAAPRRGNGGFGGIPSQTFTCADGKDIFVVASTARQWAALAAVIERPDLITDDRYATVPARIANRGLVLSTLSTAFGRRPASHWLPALEAVDVPVSPVNELDDVFANPQVRHRGLAVPVVHPVAGRVDVLRNPLRLSDTPIEEYRSPPTLGQHTNEVLAEVLGLSPEEIDGLEKAGAL
jgi:crotonobetainyl-CoA:carnitine CoA-transferase CaiB-like acyl-CoA transferase